MEWRMESGKRKGADAAGRQRRMAEGPVDDAGREGKKEKDSRATAGRAGSTGTRRRTAQKAKERARDDSAGSVSSVDNGGTQ